MNIMYNVCKRTIERGNHPEDLMVRIEAFYKANLITEKEYEVLKQMLNK